MTAAAGPACTATASIDNGSVDPDGDPLTLSQDPAAPYSLGATGVTLTATYSFGASGRCTAAVTVVDNTPLALPSWLVVPASIVTTAAGLILRTVSFEASATRTVPMLSIAGVQPGPGALDRAGGWTTLSATVKHRETYMTLLSPALRDRLLATLKEEGILTLLKAHALRVVDATPVPYVRLEITAGQNGLVAHCTGVWFDVRPLVGPEGDEDYYLPVLGAAEGASAATIGHELLHLHDLLALIEQDPSYTGRALELGINSVSEPAQIEESVEFELFKIFAMEPQAYRLEYEMGETWIDASHAGQPVRYHCATAEELVTMRLADYVATLERRYAEKFPGFEATIRKAVRQSVNHHGREAFGAQAYERIQQVNAVSSLKILAQFSRRSV